MRCRVCSEEFTGNYCPSCGTSAQPFLFYRAGTVEVTRLAGSAIWTFAVLSFAALLISYLVVHFIGIETIVPNILSSGSEAPLFLITPLPARFAVLEGYWFVGWYFFIFVAVFLSILWVFYISLKPTWNVMKKPPEDLRARLESKVSIALIAGLFFAILFFDLVYYFVLALAGVSPNVPKPGSGELWESMFLFAHASVLEEIVTRIPFIGLPLFIIAYASGRRIGRRQVPRYVLGGGFRLDRMTAILLIFSSTMFALAHVFSWDVYKIPPTFIAGLALGYLYLKKGLFASIVLHFSFNYLGILTGFIEGNVVALMVLGLVITIIGGLIAGALFFTDYARKVYGFLVPRAAVPPPGPQDSEPLIYFQCPMCAGLEARYSEGGFECLNCGYKK